jgi:hypothetical protein
VDKLHFLASTKAIGNKSNCKGTQVMAFLLPWAGVAALGAAGAWGISAATAPKSTGPVTNNYSVVGGDAGVIIIVLVVAIGGGWCVRSETLW